MPHRILESRFRTIFEQSPYSIQILAPDGKTILVNKAFRKLWGISDDVLENYILKDYNILTDPVLERTGLAKLVRRAFAGEVVEGPPIYYDPAEMGVEGTAAWASGLFYPIKRDDGSVSEVIVIHTDITKEQEERKEKERLLAIQSFLAEVSAVLHESLDYDTIIDQIANAAIPAFSDGVVVDILDNNVIRRIFTRHHDAEGEAAMKELQAHFPPDLDTSPAPTARVLRTGKAELLSNVDLKVIREHTVSQRHAELLQKIGTNSHIAVPLSIRGKITGSLNFHITTRRKKFDETDLKTAEELARRAAIAIENARLYRQAQHAIAQREEFISIASHELKTPITSLKLQWEVASRVIEDSQEKIDPAYVKRLAAISNRQLDRLTRLVEDMLDVSRMTTGKLPMNMKEVELDRLVTDVAERFRDQLRDQGISFTLTGLVPVTLRCDQFRMEQVITNLISNAIRYGLKKPITVSMEKSSDAVKVKVADEGRGIAKEDQERIFERFVRAVSVHDQSGLGLGLYISREIVKEHGGKLSVQSESDQGSVFTMELPLQ